MDRRGLTLLEALLALTILSLAGAIAYSSLATTLASWRAGVTRGRERQVAQVALDRLAGQLKSAVPAVAEGDSGPVAAFTGGEDSIRFVTLLPVSGRPVAQVSYSIEEKEGRSRLVYREYPWPDKEFAGEGGTPWLEEEVDEIEGMTVAFRSREEEAEGAGGEEPEEPREWRPGDEESLPGAVEISLLVAGAAEREREAGLYRTVVPVLAEPFLAPAERR